MSVELLEAIYESGHYAWLADQITDTQWLAIQNFIEEQESLLEALDNTPAT